MSCLPSLHPMEEEGSDFHTMAEQQKQINRTFHASPTIDSFPLEILEKIIQYLPIIEKIRVEKVCEKWRAASRNAWKNIESLSINLSKDTCEFYRFKNCVKPRDFIIVEDHTMHIGTNDLRVIRGFVARIGRNIKNFFYYGNRYERGGGNYKDILLIMSEYCYNIEVMEFDACTHEIDKTVMSKLFEVNEEMNSIKMNQDVDVIPIRNWKCLRSTLPVIFRLPNHIKEKMPELIRNSPSLEKFEIHHWSQDIVTELLKCKELKQLHLYVDVQNYDLHAYGEVLHDIHLMNRLTVLVIDSFELETIKDILTLCINLEILSVSSLNSYEVDDDVGMFFENLLTVPRLKALRLIDCEINDVILRRLTKFTHLSLCDSYYSITPESLVGMIKYSEQLETLNIMEFPDNFTRSFLQKIVEQTRNRLESLQINVHYTMYEEAFKICENSKIQIVTASDFFKCIDKI